MSRRIMLDRIRFFERARGKIQRECLKGRKTKKGMFLGLADVCFYTCPSRYVEELEVRSCWEFCCPNFEFKSCFPVWKYMYNELSVPCFGVNSNGNFRAGGDELKRLIFNFYNCEIMKITTEAPFQLSLLSRERRFHAHRRLHLRTTCTLVYIPEPITSKQTRTFSNSDHNQTWMRKRQFSTRRKDQGRWLKRQNLFH